ncbi:hypothetical protein HELRODRAFT_83945, partial [Helobdella robusta]|uniref:Polycystin cation channel PKD1/PKD2 domain-containing protein n=1 Tax=Helobdella robusta TaxID=6412 RepID=T1G5C2_HELRO
KYLNFNSTLWSLSKTVYLCTKELTSLIILSGVVYFAFAIAGHALFGYNFEEFSTITYSCASMIRVILGDMDFQLFKTGMNFFGMIFILLFESLMFFVFMAVFLAIILYAYSQVSVLHQKQKFEMQMLEYTYRVGV